MGFSIKQQIRSFRYAFAGIRYLVTTQHNAWIQLSIGVLTILAGIILDIDRLEWCIILLCIGAVLSMEALNTSIELLADTLHPGQHDGIRKVKDVAAGAVLIVSIVALFAGLFIFAPRIITLLTF
jgi:diacylglycerol kinase (ATP)